MRVMDPIECGRWCASRQVAFDDKRNIIVDATTERRFKICLPESGLDIARMGLALSRDQSGFEHSRFLLWLTECGMWNQAMEALGSRLWDRLIQGNLGKQTAGEVVACLFDGDEMYDKAACLTTIMLFQWDAILVPDHGEYAVQIDHDGYIALKARIGTASERAIEDLAKEEVPQS